MKKVILKKINCVDILLHIIALISIFVIITQIFQNLRIPYSCLSRQQTESFNDILYSLACGYLGSYITYMLTVKLKNLMERKRFIWQIYELEGHIIEAWNNYLNEFTKRAEALTSTDFCKDMIDDGNDNLNDTDDVSIKTDIYKAGLNCRKVIENEYEKLRVYDSYLTEFEHNCIKTILDASNYLNEDAIHDKCMTTYKTLNVLWYNAFQICSETINALNNSIIKNIRNEKK